MLLSLSSVKYGQEPMAEALLSLKHLESANLSINQQTKLNSTKPLGATPVADSGAHCGPDPTCPESVIWMEASGSVLKPGVRSCFCVQRQISGHVLCP